MKKDSFFLNTDNYFRFIHSVIICIFESCREAPFVIIPIITIVFIWSNISKEITKRSNQSIDKALVSKSTNNITSIIFLMLLDCVSKSAMYWLRPLFETKITSICEYYLFKKYLKMDFENFYEYGPALNSAILFRYSSKVSEASTKILFDTFDSVAGVFSSFIFLYSVLEKDLFIKFSMSLFLICILEILIFKKVVKIKQDCIEIDDKRAENMTECFENSLISRFVDEKDRMNTFFVSSALLKYSVFSRTINFVKCIALLATSWYVLANNRFRNPISLIRELSNASNSVKRLINMFFDLEVIRIEISHRNELFCKSNVEKTIKNETYHQNLVNDKLIFKMEDVSISFKNKLILQNIFLSVEKGEKIALFGKNGSGKSTFFKFILGFLQHTGNFESVKNIKFSYIPQNTFLNGTIYDELYEFCKCNQEIMKNCKNFGAYEFISALDNGFLTNTKDLSESQRQIIKIIQGISRHSTLLLADEPTTGLNDELKERILDLILESQSHETKMVILHEKKFFNKFDRVFFFDNQKIKIN